MPNSSNEQPEASANELQDSLDSSSATNTEKYSRAQVAIAVAFGALILHLSFIASYVSAFHEPTPHEIKIAVVAGPDVPSLAGNVAEQTVTRLNHIDNKPLDARAVATEEEARSLIKNREVQGAFIIHTNTDDQLIVASGAGSSIATSLETIFTKIETTQQRKFTTTDQVPVGKQDNRGLSGFYLSVGWVVGGYLFASAIGLVIGSPTTFRQSGGQLLLLAGYSTLSGILGAIITTSWLHAFDGYLMQLGLLGVAVVFATGAFTIGLRVLFGLASVPFAILLFVVFGNPSAGGGFGAQVLPTFFATIGPWITPGAGTEAVRSIVYFNGVGLTQPLLALGLYSLFGLTVTLGFHRAKKLLRQN
ncbi:MAG: ABC transporter permease [Mycobacteriaceae bacterium]